MRFEVAITGGESVNQEKMGIIHYADFTQYFLWCVQNVVRIIFRGEGGGYIAFLKLLSTVSSISCQRDAYTKKGHIISISLSLF